MESKYVRMSASSTYEIDRRLLHDLVLEGWDRDRSLPPILLRNVDPAKRLRSIPLALEAVVELLNVRSNPRLVFLVRDTVHPFACILPQTLERCVQRLRREKVSDREELPLLV